MTNLNYIIRIYQQCLPIELSVNDLKSDLRENGLEVIKFAWSTFGGCFFFEVKGEYTGLIECEKTDINPQEFDWII